MTSSPESRWVVDEYVEMVGRVGWTQSEDKIIIGSRYIGVLDASSGSWPVPRRLRNESSGLSIGTLVKNCFERSQRPFFETLQACSEDVAHWKSSHGMRIKGTGGCFLAVIDVSIDIIYVIGDCWAAIGKEIIYQDIQIENTLSKMKNDIYNTDMPIVEKNSLYRGIISSYLKYKEFYENNLLSEKGFAVINGDVVHESSVIKRSINSSVSLVCLGTDGFFAKENSIHANMIALEKLRSSDYFIVNNVFSPKIFNKTGLYDDASFVRLIRN